MPAACVGALFLHFPFAFSIINRSEHQHRRTHFPNGSFYTHHRSRLLIKTQNRKMFAMYRFVSLILTSIKSDSTFARPKGRSGNLWSNRTRGKYQSSDKQAMEACCHEFSTGCSARRDIFTRDATSFLSPTLPNTIFMSLSNCCTDLAHPSSPSLRVFVQLRFTSSWIFLHANSNVLAVAELHICCN